MTDVFRKRTPGPKSRMLETLNVHLISSDDNINTANVKIDEERTEIDSFDHVIAINRWCMKILGFWPLENTLFSNLQCGLIITVISLFTLPPIMELTLASRGWDAIMRQAVMTIPLIPIIGRFVFMKAKSENFSIILRTMIADWAYYRHLSKRNQQIMVHYAGKSKKFNICSITLMAFTIVGYVMTPFINMWVSDVFWNATTRNLPFSGLYPFFFKESPVFELLYIMQLIVAFFVGTAIISVDCFLFTVIFHACGQFDILAATLKRYDSFTKHDYTRSRACACLSCVVKRHVHILNYMDIIERTFRNFYLIQLVGYCFNLVLFGRQLIMYVNIQNNDFNGIITCIIYAITTIYIIFVWCYVSECIIRKSENIGRVAHNLEWYRFPRDSNLTIIVARSRKPCKITAGKFVTLSLSYYTTILITAISYISILAAFK